MKPFDTLTIEPDPDAAGCWLCGHGEYEPSSVLAGQYRFARLDHFPGVVAAREHAATEYPGIPVEEIDPPRAYPACVSDCPPADFDPADIGESWN